MSYLWKPEILDPPGNGVRCGGYLTRVLETELEFFGRAVLALNLLSYLLSPRLFVFETRSLISQAGLKFTVQPRLSLNWSFWLFLWSAGIIGKFVCCSDQIQIFVDGSQASTPIDWAMPSVLIIMILTLYQCWECPSAWFMSVILAFGNLIEDDCNKYESQVLDYKAKTCLKKKKI